MLVLVIVLAVVAAIAIVLALVTRSRLAAQRVATVSATTAREAEEARAAAAEAARDHATTRLADVEAQVVGAEAQVADAENRLTEIEDRLADAEERLAHAEAAAARTGGLDPDLLWALEQARSERTWRQSVAVGSEGASVFDGTDHALRDALQVELDAAREDVGALVELECDVPPTVTTAGAVLVLRAAQELLAGAVKAAEESTLRVVADGADVLLTIVAVDEHGEPATVEPLAVPSNPDLESADGTVRIRRAIPA